MAFKKGGKGQSLGVVDNKNIDCPKCNANMQYDIDRHVYVCSTCGYTSGDSSLKRMDK